MKEYIMFKKCIMAYKDVFFCKKCLFYCRCCNRKNNNSIDGLMSKEKSHFFLDSPSSNIKNMYKTM